MSLDVWLTAIRSTTVFESNITHNLGAMAKAAGLYTYLWRPEELAIATKAGDLIVPLREGLERLRADPEKYKALNPPNGWGNYDDLVEFVAQYLKACETNPDATVKANR